MAASIEERLSKVEGVVSEHDRIFDSNFKWLVAIQITTLVAIIGMGVSITLAVLPR
ncbi:MAG: hypothetical protein ISS94_02165 [Candidatus Syntrophoarchaeum sp.]|nr:hypothetical protein [Methanomicrobia archaeon]MBL7117575.1 hypothetical protein [Candidatus Syntrophoarchaeum sp.]